MEPLQTVIKTVHVILRPSELACGKNVEELQGRDALEGNQSIRGYSEGTLEDKNSSRNADSKGQVCEVSEEKKDFQESSA